MAPNSPLERIFRSVSESPFMASLGIFLPNNITLDGNLPEIWKIYQVSFLYQEMFNPLSRGVYVCGGGGGQFSPPKTYFDATPKRLNFLIFPISIYPRKTLNRIGDFAALLFAMETTSAGAAERFKRRRGGGWG